jgi:hypothetical protein
MKFPTERFEDISKFLEQVRVEAMTPLCHSSASKWALAAGEEVNSQQKDERCAKVSGKVVYTVTLYLNEYFAGNWKPVKWTPSKKIARCLKCHDPETFRHYEYGMNHEQAQMECVPLHSDHTKE